MNTITIQNCKIIYENSDEDTAQLIREVCSKTEDLLKYKWNLALPHGTQVHIMRSWWRFPFNASNWFRKILLVISFPFWGMKAKKLWAYSGGWALPYPRQPAIGVKPPSLLQASDRSLGQRIFIEEVDENVKVQMITCHELTHASMAFLKLPAWLNEGLAMISVDDFFGYSTVKSQTLLSLQKTQPKTNPRGYRQLSITDKDTLVYTYVRGYWITRFFNQHHPEILQDILAKRRRHTEIVGLLADTLHIPENEFWQHIDDHVVETFLIINEEH